MRILGSARAIASAGLPANVPTPCSLTSAVARESCAIASPRPWAVTAISGVRLFHPSLDAHARPFRAKKQRNGPVRNARRERSAILSIMEGPYDDR